MVVWLIGKSGSGKSAIGEKLYKKLKKENSNIIYLDGDELRAAISWDLGHTIEDRYLSEKRRSKLCKLISEQGISIICSALSNSPDLRLWNKQNIKNYYDIYLETKQSTLYNRDPKGLYQKYKEKKINNIVGEDIPFFEPENPWMIIKNDGDFSVEEIVEKISTFIKKENI